MTGENTDALALTAQAGLHRLFKSIIQPGLIEFTPTQDIAHLTSNFDEFLDACEVNTNNAICWDLRRHFALIMGATFERQLRGWLISKLTTAKESIERAMGNKLFEYLDDIDPSLRAIDIFKALAELQRVCNAVRHGNGRSANMLLRDLPQFWEQQSNKAACESDPVGTMRITDSWLESWAMAGLKFWHLVGASPVPVNLLRN
jgi:hypothetical protein